MINFSCNIDKDDSFDYGVTYVDSAFLGIKNYAEILNTYYLSISNLFHVEQRYLFQVFFDLSYKFIPSTKLVSRGTIYFCFRILFVSSYASIQKTKFKFLIPTKLEI